MSSRVIQVGAFDPGSINYGGAKVSFRGFDYIKDKQGLITKMPLFEVHALELWDLERRITYRHNASYSVLTTKYPTDNNNNQDKSYIALSESLSRIVPDTKWLFETYKQLPTDEIEVLPTIAVENQPGYVLQHEVNIVLASYLLPCAIRTVDVKNGNTTRKIIGCARKYGLPIKGEKDYDRRKEISEEIGRSLLQLSGQLHWLEFVDAVLVARKRDVPHKKAQVHDIFDAMLMSLYKAITLWEEAEKLPSSTLDGPEVRYGGCTIDDDDVTQTPVILKKRKTPVKKQPPLTKPKAKRDIAAISDNIAADFEEGKKTKRKLSFVIDSDEEEKPAKKRKTKQAASVVKYKQLELVPLK